MSIVEQIPLPARLVAVARRELTERVLRQRVGRDAISQPVEFSDVDERRTDQVAATVSVALAVPAGVDRDQAQQIEHVAAREPVGTHRIGLAAASGFTHVAVRAQVLEWIGGRATTIGTVGVFVALATLAAEERDHVAVAGAALVVGGARVAVGQAWLGWKIEDWRRSAVAGVGAAVAGIGAAVAGIGAVVAGIGAAVAGVGRDTVAGVIDLVAIVGLIVAARGTCCSCRRSWSCCRSPPRRCRAHRP